VVATAPGLIPFPGGNFRRLLLETDRGAVFSGPVAEDIRRNTLNRSAKIFPRIK
jgi:hypothetical protein